VDTGDKKDRYITVRTAHTAPGWMPWAVYAVLAVCAYMFDQTGIDLYLIPIGVMAVVTTHLFFSTYNALVHLYNEKRIKDAIMAHYKPEEKQDGKAQVQAADTVHAGSRVLGSEPTEVDKGVVSSQDSTICRMKDALLFINDKCTNIGQARDIAWRALWNDEIETNKKTHGTPVEIKFQGTEERDREEAKQETKDE